jgi:hypothetical protein
MPLVVDLVISALLLAMISAATFIATHRLPLDDISLSALAHGMDGKDDQGPDKPPPGRAP